MQGAQVQIRGLPFRFDFWDVGLHWEFGRRLVNLALFANSFRFFLHLWAADSLCQDGQFYIPTFSDLRFDRIRSELSVSKSHRPDGDKTDQNGV